MKVNQEEYQLNAQIGYELRDNVRSLIDLANTKHIITQTVDDVPVKAIETFLLNKKERINIVNVAINLLQTNIDTLLEYKKTLKEHKDERGPKKEPTKNKENQSIGGLDISRNEQPLN